nr:hypothetical protein BaRGS_020729 [Batillaria attramentaria]
MKSCDGGSERVKLFACGTFGSLLGYLVYNVISRDTLLLLEKVVMCYVNVVLLTVGVPTNILNAIVFYRQGLRDRMNLCLFSLSIVDMFCVLIWFLLGSFCLVGHYLEDFRDLWKWQVRKYLRGFHRGFYYSSGCLTMIVAVERCICVALPFKAQSLVRTKTMGLVIFGTVVTLHLVCSVYLFNFNVVPIVDPTTNQTLVALPPTQVYADLKQFIDIMENTVIMVVIPTVTFSVVSVATGVTIVKIKQSMVQSGG